MPKLVILGAGRSAGFLIDYLLNWSNNAGFTICIADQQVDHLKPLQIQFPGLELLAANLSDSNERKQIIAGAFLVVSMLPAFMHPAIAADCVSSGSHLATASYVSEELKALEEEVVAKKLIFLNECGLDPGIDHMSAMKLFHELTHRGYQIREFHSYCGGLVAPDSVGENPWGYKFSWNPRNVILAGQGTARFLQNGKLRFLPYHRLFGQTVSVEVNGIQYDGYPNRDSLGYREAYGLETVQTMIRGTLRASGYCDAWNILVQLGLTDDSFQFPLSPSTTYRDFTSSFLPQGFQSPEDALMHICGNDQSSFNRFVWTGLLAENPIPLSKGTPAQIVQHLLEEKWKLGPSDRDLVVMQHLILAEKEGEMRELTSSLYLEGENNAKTAMAKTVGLPLAIGIKLICEKIFTTPGIHIPVMPELYEPILDELRDSFGISFEESESAVRNDIPA